MLLFVSGAFLTTNMLIVVFLYVVHVFICFYLFQARVWGQCDVFGSGVFVSGIYLGILLSFHFWREFVHISGASLYTFLARVCTHFWREFDQVAPPTYTFLVVK